MRKYFAGIITRIENDRSSGRVTLKNEITDEIATFPFYRRLEENLVGEHAQIEMTTGYDVIKPERTLSEIITFQRIKIFDKWTEEVKGRFKIH